MATDPNGVAAVIAECAMAAADVVMAHAMADAAIMKVPGETMAASETLIAIAAVVIVAPTPRLVAGMMAPATITAEMMGLAVGAVIVVERQAITTAATTAPVIEVVIAAATRAITTDEMMGPGIEVASAAATLATIIAGTMARATMAEAGAPLTIAEEIAAQETETDAATAPIAIAAVTAAPETEADAATPTGMAEEINVPVTAVAAATPIAVAAGTSAMRIGAVTALENIAIRGFAMAGGIIATVMGREADMDTGVPRTPSSTIATGTTHSAGFM